MLEALISFSLATIVLAFSPGPDNIYVLTQSISNGSKAGIATVAGLISGCIVHTALLALVQLIYYTWRLKFIKVMHQLL